MATEHTDAADAESLGFVRETRARLVQALHPFHDWEGMDAVTLIQGFLADQMNKTAEGYVMLREARRVDCSKLLIRPIIETTIRMLALDRHPGLIYRVAYTECQSYKALVRAAALSQGEEAPDLTAQGLAKFKQICQTQIPGADLTDAKIRLIDLAEKAGPAVKDLYQGQYRVYCNFTHSSIEAITRRWNDLTDPRDNETVILGLSNAIDVLVKIAERRNPMSP